MNTVNYDFSFIKQDTGYNMMKINKLIIHKFPYKQDIEPRLISYLRTYYVHKLLNTSPCVPLTMQYWIRDDDIESINRYLHKYKIII
ncbi:hypothetical protein QKU48_gp0139 [Fadolivirus algeromassiliense]|uniref:Uncharacterized protein n=1 Tax=Fadolivirus FV1/VV64 TaxID=3070911 RepID=A0A7D3V8J3_9VIRU|nr:hypothetical protein QKU48_gp0139 [Fadolivirus algeromassiliense]QKF93597.1 hypothetical protein Fadolivirus_1_139 [Fadolivirus FV1/VV64]